MLMASATSIGISIALIYILDLRGGEVVGKVQDMYITRLLTLA